MTDTQTVPVGCCGHDCARCKIYLAGQNKDDTLRTQSQAFYRDTFSVDLPIEAFVCRGCRSDLTFVLCRDCPFTACADRHGVETCEGCAEYPCQMLCAYRESYVNQCNQIPL